MLATLQPTRIPNAWLKHAYLQRKQTDQFLITALKKAAPNIRAITTFGVQSQRYGVEAKGFGLDHNSFMAAVIDAAGARVPSSDEIEAFLEQEYNATGYLNTMTEVLEYTMDGVWTAA